jgi:hypothetical protein
VRKTLLGISVVSSIILGIAGAANARLLSDVHRVSNSETLGVQTVDYRRCWWDAGRRVCRYVYEYRDLEWRYRHRGGSHRDWY